MKVTEDMKVKQVLALGDQMLEAFYLLAPAFERLRYPKLRRAMSGRVNVAQAARIGGVPIAEALYVLNLAAGCSHDELADELGHLPRESYEVTETNAYRMPKELRELEDDDRRVRFVDVMEHAFQHKDPLPTIARGLISLEGDEEVLLVRHPFDPIPLRDMFARRGFSSWAEERRPDDWYIYFFKPAAKTAAAAHPPVGNKAFAAAANGNY